MDFLSKQVVKNLLLNSGIRPSKRFGQNFLIDKSVLKKIIKAANLCSKDIILEIGPGIGNLTQELAKRVKMITAIEKDPKMVEILKKLLERWNVRNVKIIEGDILKVDPNSYTLKPYTLKPYKLVANLPYYIVSPVIRRFLEMRKPPKEMILMVQKEVAQRICAKPPKMNLLAVSVQFYAEPKIISYISRKSFWPQPKVDGAIIKIVSFQRREEVPYKKQAIACFLYGTAGKKDLFFKIVKAGFSQPRKQILNNLSRLNFSEKNLGGEIKSLKVDREKIKSWLLKNNIQPSQRAETLNIDDWIKLAKTFKFLLLFFFYFCAII